MQGLTLHLLLKQSNISLSSILFTSSIVDTVAKVHLCAEGVNFTSVQAFHCAKGNWEERKERTSTLFHSSSRMSDYKMICLSLD